MSKCLWLACAVILFAGSLSFLAANDKPQTWKGYVTLVCTAPPAAGAAAGEPCLYSLFTPADNKLYVLKPQEEAAKYSKKLVSVTGTISGRTKMKIATNNGIVEATTIRASSISPVPGS